MKSRFSVVLRKVVTKIKFPDSIIRVNISNALQGFTTVKKKNNFLQQVHFLKITGAAFRAGCSFSSHFTY